MKNIINLFALVFILNSCSKEIDLAPLSTPSVADFYKDANDLEAAVNGAYNALQQKGQYGQSYSFYGEVRSDNSEEIGESSGGIFREIDDFSLQSSNSIVNDTWEDAYKGISSCNAILNRIDGIPDLDQNTRQIRKGEVLFIRALTYFNLVRIFGDVPLVVEETVDPFEAFGNGRDASSDVYNQIISDLTEATTILPQTQNVVGKATRGAAFALLGKVQLTLGNYSDAVTALNNVTGYTLVNNFEDIFGAQNENNSESIFEVQYVAGRGSAIVSGSIGTGAGEGSAYPNLFGPPGGNALVENGGALGLNKPTQDLWDSYNPADLRREATIGIFGANQILYPKKLVGPSAGPLDSDINAIVLRFADVLLMKAEALNELGYQPNGEAWTLINQVRSRAGLADLTPANITNQDEFRVAVENERRWELAFENHRWFDLLRTERALEVINSHRTGATNVLLDFVNSNHLVFPIPSGQIDTNPALTQNPGY